MSLLRVFLVLPAFVAFGSAAVAQDAWTPTHHFLPMTVEGFLQTPNYPQLEEAWNKTSIGQLFNDRRMQPFIESQRAIMNREWDGIGLRLGLTLEDVQEIASGEVLAAWYGATEPRHEYRVLVSVDTRGRDAALGRFLTQLRADLQQRDATRTVDQAAGVELEIHELPRRPGDITIRQVVVAVAQGRLILADRADVVRALLAELQGATGQKLLVDTEAFKAVEHRLSHDDQPLIRWFVRPLDFAATLQKISAGPGGSTDDIVGLLRNQGFDALQGAGGHFHFGEPNADIVHHAWIYAPPTTDKPDKYELAARMLQFPNSQIEPPPGWVLPGAGTYARLNWRLEEAFWAAETLVNEAIGADTFRDTLEGIREDPQGPQIDIANDIVANFDDRVTAITDSVITPDEVEDRLALGIRLTNAQQTKAALDKTMRNDPNAFAFPYDGHEIWEVRQQAEPADLDIGNIEDFGFDIAPTPGQPGAAGAGNGPLLDHWAITVHGDWLFFSSHAQMLVDIIQHAERPAGDQQPLGKTAEYTRAVEVLTDRGVDKPAFFRVMLPGRACRGRYELLKRGQLKESESIFMSVVRRIFSSEGDNGLPEIDNKKLPPFAVLEDYMTPLILSFTTEPDGWSSQGVMLSRPDQE